MKVRLDDIEVYFEDRGKGEPLLFLHGFPFDHQMWSSQLGALAGKCRVIAPDLRGFGDSSRPEGVYTMTRFADDLRKLLDQLEIKKVTMIGLSMGGYIALAFAERCQGRLKRLVLSNTRSAADAESARKNRYHAVERIKEEGVGFLIRDMPEKVLCPLTLKSRPELVEVVRHAIERQPSVGIIGALQGMAQRKDRTSLLKEITVPTLVIAGREDSLIPVDEAEQMIRELPRGHLEVIAAAGHLANLEQPRIYNELLTGFLRSG